MRSKKARLKRLLTKHLVYYPAGGVIALSPLLGMKKPSKLKVNENTQRLLSLTGTSLASLREGKEVHLDRTSSGDSFRNMITREHTPEALLQEAFRRSQLAQQHWEQGELQEAGLDTDAVSWLLSFVPDTLEPQQSQIRAELRGRQATLIVLLNEAAAGKSAGTSGPDQAPVEQLGPVPLELNESVQREIDRFCTTQRKTFLDGYQLAGAHMPYIERKLAEHGMPKELGWLPLIESGFRLKAESGASALGLWQFMPATGDQFGLSRDRWIDRRMDPEQASEAAVVYLKYLYLAFGKDWNKALAAYNWGEGNIRKVLKKFRRPEDEVSFWDIQSKLPEETARYVPKFLAAVNIVSKPQDFGFSGLGSQDVPKRYEVVELEKQVDMDALAGVMGLDWHVLSELNPELLQRVTPPQKHGLRVPIGYGKLLLATLPNIPEYRPQPQPEPLVARRTTRPGILLVSDRHHRRIRSPGTSLLQARARVRSKAGHGKKAGPAGRGRPHTSGKSTKAARSKRGRGRA